MFGTWLRTTRESFGLTQGELARMSGISASAIGMYEQGRRKPSPAAQARLGCFWRERGVVMPEVKRRAPEDPKLVEALRDLRAAPSRRGR